MTASAAPLSARKDLVRSRFVDPDVYLRDNHAVDLRSRIVRDLLRAYPKGRMLDLGCGDGSISLPLLHDVDELTLVDFSPAMLVKAAGSIPPGSASKVRLVEADLETFVAPHAYDAVLCLGVLAHVDSPRATIATIAKALRRGGVALVQITDADWWPGRMMLNVERLKKRCGLGNPYTLHRTAVSDIVAYAAGVGLILQRTERYGVPLPGIGRLPQRLRFSCEEFGRRMPGGPLFATDVVMTLSRVTE